MAWFAELAGKAENLLNNLDEQTGAALRNHNISKKNRDRSDVTQQTDGSWSHRRRSSARSPVYRKSVSPDNKSALLSKKPSPLSTKQFPLSTKSSPLSTKPSPLSSKPSPTSFNRQAQTKYIYEGKPMKTKSRKLNPHYNLNHCPKTLVNDDHEKNRYGSNTRRYSLPENLEEYAANDEMTYEMQNLEIENAMLKNEVNVLNREVAELAEKLPHAEDDVTKSLIKLETAGLLYQRVSLERDNLASQIQQLKEKLEERVSTEVTKYLELNTSMQIEIDSLKKKVTDYEEKCKELTDKSNEKDINILKLENDLRHSQLTVSNLQSDLEKSNEECKRLEKDWEAYKLRVKNMLTAKDSVIKSLQEGMEMTTDTKDLMNQIDKLKEERDELSDVANTIREECENMKMYMQQVETRHVSGERVVCALRDALRDEQRARNKADAQWAAVATELKTLQTESGQTIASLRIALREMEEEIARLRESSAAARSTDTSALNVADYNTIESNKIQTLTHTLVLKQSKIDKLLAENNVLKIQLEKLESKMKAEMSPGSRHSLVQLQDIDYRHRSKTYAATDTLSALSIRIGVMVKRYPIMGVFLMVYMICLHLWVVYVLCLSTPEDILKRPSKT